MKPILLIISMKLNMKENQKYAESSTLYINYEHVLKFCVNQFQ